MNTGSGLSLDQAPPISVPFRFFLTAPLFAVAAALAALWQGPMLYDSRWTPAMLGITHLLTLGYMGLVMMGALLQMLPVVAGTPVRQPVRVASIVHVLATAGIAMLAGGLMFTLPHLLHLAMLALGLVLPAFAGLVFLTLRRALPHNLTAQAMRLAVLMFAATVLLGLVLLSNHAFGWWLHVRQTLTDLHLAWGLLGWVGILIAGVSYQVVPMFLLTSRYPPRLTRWLAPSLFALLLSLVVAGWSPTLRGLLGIALAASFAVFAVVTLWLQQERRRKLPDVPLNFWRFGLFYLLAAVALWCAAQLSAPLAAMPQVDILLGVLMIAGFAMSLINGMLYKILPFLVWFHLQSRRGVSGIKVPNVREVLPESRTRPQMWLHFIALAALLAAVVFPGLFAVPAALSFAASNLWLWWNIVTASRSYRRVLAQIETAD
jgi:hypothetical protein